MNMNKFINFLCLLFGSVIIGNYLKDNVIGLGIFLISFAFVNNPKE
jgi:hypothetical protein